jgi:nucleolar complex protein 3
VEIVRLLAKLAKEKPHAITPRMLSTFLKLRLSHTIINAEAEKSKDKQKKRLDKDKKFDKMKKNQRKELDKEVDKDLAEAEATVRVDTQQRVQLELLNLVMVTYVRILKDPRRPVLLPVVLAGLAKYAHLINIDMVIDLLEVLRQLIAKGTLELASVLHCLIAAFETLSGPGQALTIEVVDFYKHLFNHMWRLTEPENFVHVPLFLQAMQLMFIKRRLLGMDLVAAFVKRLVTVACTLLPHDAIGVLSLMRQLLDKYPRTQQLLENDPTPIGIFRPDIDEPAHANALATSAWELTLLRASYHPFLTRFAGLVVKHTELPAAVARLSPNALVEAYDCSQGGFNPAVQAPPTYPPSKRVYKIMDYRTPSPWAATLLAASRQHTVGASSMSTAPDTGTIPSMATLLAQHAAQQQSAVAARLRRMLRRRDETLAEIEE